MKKLIFGFFLIFGANAFAAKTCSKSASIEVGEVCSCSIDVKRDCNCDESKAGDDGKCTYEECCNSKKQNKPSPSSNS